MVGVASNPKDGRSRLCLCCGEPTATRSIPACWDHWIALPEDLQSAIVISTGRGEIGRYGDCLMEAVQIWRQTGLWRSRYVKTRVGASGTDARRLASCPGHGNIVPCQTGQPKASPKAERQSEVGIGFERQAFGQSQRTDASG